LVFGALFSFAGIYLAMKQILDNILLKKIPQITGFLTKVIESAYYAYRLGY